MTRQITIASQIASAALAIAMSAGAAMGAQSLAIRRPALPQNPSANTGLALEVHDSSGAVVPSARITITNEMTGATIEASTDASGQLEMLDVPAGTYDLAIRYPGFAVLKLTSTTVPVADKLKLQLEVGVSVDPVTVYHAPIETESSPNSDDLSEPSAAPPAETNGSPPHPTLFRRFFSGLRHIF
jgi:hypothetical protein